MYKIMATDLDDTLLNNNMEISDENIAAIKRIQNMGVHIVFCSGRSTESMMKYIDSLNIHTDEDYFISYNGANIQQVNGTNIFYKPIRKPLLTDLIKIGEKYKVSIQLYTDRLLAQEHTEEVKGYEKLSGLKATIIDDLNDISITTKLLYNYNDINILNILKKEIEEFYLDQVNIFFSKPTYLEVLNKSANKGLAIKHLAQHLNISQNEIIAIGDSENDLDMIQYAGVGVAVKNGRASLKEKADYITKKTNDENAVAEVINKYFI